MNRIRPSPPSQCPNRRVLNSKFNLSPSVCLSRLPSCSAFFPTLCHMAPAIDNSTPSLLFLCHSRTFVLAMLLSGCLLRHLLTILGSPLSYFFLWAGLGPLRWLLLVPWVHDICLSSGLSNLHQHSFEQRRRKQELMERISGGFSGTQS